MIQPTEMPQDFELEDEQDLYAPRRYIVQETQSGHRLDKVLAQCLSEHSRARLQGWIEQGHVTVNGLVQTRVRLIVSDGDEIVVVPQPAAEELAFEPQNIDFDVIAQTEQWIVVNKRPGLVVHPGSGNWGGTLLNGLLFRYPELASVARAGIVHRLDKDTSGLMVVARTPTAQTHLVRQLQQRAVKRQYVALAHGYLTQVPRTIDAPVGRDPRVPVRMAVLGSGLGKPAITEVVLSKLGELDGMPVSGVRCQLQTGRTHQIRVHFSSLGHPLVGDTLYGGRALADAKRQMLHAERLEFVDPVNEQWVCFETAVAGDMQSVLTRVKWAGEELAWKS